MTAIIAIGRSRRSTAAWCIGAGIVGLAIIATSALSTTFPILITIGITAIVISAARPKAFVVIGLTVMALTVLLERLAGRSAGNADELVVLVSVVAFSTRRIVTEGRLVRPPGTVLMVLFLVAGLISSAEQHVPASIVVSAALIYLKAALYAFALAQLHWNERDLGLLVKFGGVAVLLVSIAGIVNLAIPYQWAEITTGHPPISFVGPIAALNGLFQHPAAMSRFCALLAMGAFSYAVVVRNVRNSVLATVVTTALSILTFEVKSLLGLVAAYVMLGGRWMRPKALVALLCVAPLVLVVAGPAVVYLVGSTLDTYVFQESARLRLTTGALDLASLHLPFGAGLGRWGSSPAATDYSPLYTQFGFNKIYGLSPDKPQFLNDTQWPGILGETGWAGALLFLGAIVVSMLSLVKPVAVDERPLERWIRTAGLAWTIVLLVESVAAPVFVSTPSYPFLFLGAGIVASIRLDRKEAPFRDQAIDRLPTDVTSSIPAMR